MARQYHHHGIVSLIKRQGRRRGEVDGRTTAAKDAESVRQRIVNEDKGGEQNCTGTMLIAIQLVKANLAKWIEISDAIEKYKQEHPKVRENPKGLATLDSYLNQSTDKLIKLLPIIGLDKLPPKTKTFSDWLHEEGDNDDKQAENPPPDTSRGCDTRDQSDITDPDNPAPDDVVNVKNVKRSEVQPAPESAAMGQPLSQAPEIDEVKNDDPIPEVQ